MKVKSYNRFLIAAAFAVTALSFGSFLGTKTVSADDKKTTAFTDPTKAGKDFEVQGEYLGNGPDDAKIGVQIIALGGGKFDLVAYPGGLPGDGWSRGMPTIQAKGEWAGDAVVFKPADEENDGSGEWKDGGFTVYDGDNNTLFELAKTTRKSPTLGAQPPINAVVLFDGSTADTFEGGKLFEKDLLAATNCTSKEKLGDHTLHVEFRTPFMPAARGQGRGNSGVYIQSRYECQVLDSFGLDGKDNECGGIYQISKPAVNMCLPPLSWQTYDMEFTAAKFEDGKKVKTARVTIKHNGVVIHDDIELPKQTPGCKNEGPEMLGVFFQNHGNPVAFRNVWVVRK